MDARIDDIDVDELDAANLIPGGLFPGNLTTYYNAGLPVQSGIPTITISTGAGKLSINNTGKVGYATGNEPVSPLTLLRAYTKCNANITVEQGARLVIGADGAAKHGVLSVLDGSTVHIKTGATLHVTSDQSALLINSGATLILDAGAIVVLESPGSNIRIEGALVWNGDISFSGLGYFDFTKTHTLEFGPQADAFRLTGAGKDNRFIHIGAETTLFIPDGKGLDLEAGTIEHYGYEIQLGAASWCNLNAVKMYGDAVTGITGDQVGNFLVEDCTFEGLTFPIEILGASVSGIFGPLTQIRYTDFNNYQTGAHFRGRFVVLFENCLFSGTPGISAQNGIFSDFNFAAIIRDCAVNDHDAGVLDAGNIYDPLFAGDAGMGVKAEGGFILWMDGGEINNCEIGIGNLALDPANGAPTNIYMNHFATIRNCHSGVVMKGDATTGLVMMDCARILEIGKSGIYGEDITLLIDPLLINIQSGGTNPVDPNVFTRYYSGPPINYLDVCYKTKTPSEPLPAKLNYWGTIVGGVVETNTNPNASIALSKTSSTGILCDASFNADVSQALQIEPSGCARELGPMEPDDCLLEIMEGSPVTVRQAFREGMDLVKDEEFESAQTTFGDVAGLWQPTLPGYTNYCETLIDAARSLSEGESRGQALVNSSTGAYLFPNPAWSEATVSLPAGNCRLRVWNTFGKLICENSASGSCRLDVSTWPGGLYWIDIMERDAGVQELLKLAVQR